MCVPINSIYFKKQDIRLAPPAATSSNYFHPSPLEGAEFIWPVYIASCIELLVELTVHPV